VDKDVPRLRISAAQAIKLLDAQVISGEELRKAAMHASRLKQLRALRRQVLLWSERNEQVLLIIFERPERATYRTGAPYGVSGRTVASLRAQLARQVDSQLGYLCDAMTHASQASTSASKVRLAVPQASDPGASASKHPGATTSEPPKRRWRIFWLNPWTLGVATPLIVAAILAARSSMASWITGATGSLVTGSVVCESGRPVVGVWIAASGGQRDSGFAHLGPAADTAGNHAAGSAATYSYLLTSGGSYSVHVGCGGSAANWTSSSYSPVLQVRSVDLRCNDLVVVSGSDGSLRGICTITRKT
jgi:hypothetical protein